MARRTIKIIISIIVVIFISLIAYTIFTVYTDKDFFIIAGNVYLKHYDQCGADIYKRFNKEKADYFPKEEIEDYNEMHAAECGEYVDKALKYYKKDIFTFVHTDEWNYSHLLSSILELHGKNEVNKMLDDIEKAQKGKVPYIEILYLRFVTYVLSGEKEKSSEILEYLVKNHYDYSDNNGLVDFYIGGLIIEGNYKEARKMVREKRTIIEKTDKNEVEKAKTLKQMDHFDYVIKNTTKDIQE